MKFGTESLQAALLLEIALPDLATGEAGSRAEVAMCLMPRRGSLTVGPGGLLTGEEAVRTDNFSATSGASKYCSSCRPDSHFPRNPLEEHIQTAEAGVENDCC
mmetsp:Transcript_96552/g.176659  ORF Transcript_96552/g.176659 Transcript_96552/m.176659 type:complete len:103 (+) Transcript_96552:126-434(+)